MNILIVDDELHILEDLANEITTEGHSAFTAQTINNAKDILSSTEIDFVIIDLNLDYDTSFGGLEVFKFAKFHRPKTKPIILSAYPIEYVVDQLKKDTTNLSSIKNLIEDVRNNYIYKGGSKNYIEAVLEFIGIVQKKIMWYGNYHALLIANQSYHSKAINNLTYPIKDALELKAVLETHYEFENQNITLLKNPNREEIINEFERLSKVLSKKNNLLIFYAGHGFWVNKRKQGYWLPCNSDVISPSNWISNSEIRDFIRAIKSQHTLLISDACFSGAIFRSRNNSRNMSLTMVEKYKKRSRIAITSSDDKQIVPDKSIFIEYLIECLKENEEKYLYANKLYVNILDLFSGNGDISQNPVYGSIRKTGNKVGGGFIFVKRN